MTLRCYPCDGVGHHPCGVQQVVLDFLVAFHDFISFGILYHRLPVEGSEIPPTKFTTAYTGVYSLIYPAGIVTIFGVCGCLSYLYHTRHPKQDNGDANMHSAQ